jgi:hypothetical protein
MGDSWKNSDYIQNSNDLKSMLNNLPSNYSFNYFIPAPINTYDLNKCYNYSPDSSNNKIDMKDISNYIPNSQPVYHTNYTCKLNATILNSKNKMEEYQQINNIIKNSGLKKGLSFKIITGFYNSNPKFFSNSKENYNSTLATKFDSIQNATNNSGINYTSYSIEWYGYLKPTTTGNWRFTLNTDTTSLLWIGDIAINDYENINAFINTKGSNSNTLKLNANKHYPIRIQYGNETLNEQNKFSFSIEGPNGEDGIPLLCCLYKSDGTLFEKTLMYYSLNEVTPDLTSKGLFNCYVNDPKDKNNSLQLKQSPNDVAICDGITNSARPVHYNKSNNKNQYLYLIDGDPRMNQLFMKKSAYNVNKLLQVSPDDTISTNSYVQYKNMYPLESDKESAIRLSNKNCETNCNNDPTCSYYYTYESNMKDYCITKSDTSFPRQLTPNQPDSGIYQSTLNIRNKNPKLINKDDIRSKLNTISTNDYKSFSNYEIISDKKFIVPDKYNIGYNGLDEKDINIIEKENNYARRNGQPFESFENYGYSNKNNIADKAANPGYNKNIPDAITDNQINPLTRMYQDYSKLQQNINNNYYDISGSIYKIRNNSKTGVRDILSNDPDNIYDFSGNVFTYSSKKPKKRDALKEDTQIMVLEQNNLLMLGTITIATLLIGAIYFGRE